MDTQEHEYELGTLEEDILDRDESDARQSGNRGDERRWMILGGAGTLALLTAIVAAVSLGSSGDPRKLSASLRGPVRDLSALSAHLQSAAADVVPDSAKTPAKLASKARVARPSAQPAVPQPSAPMTATAPAAAAKPTSSSAANRASHAAVADTSASSSATPFANLPALSDTAAADTDDGPDPTEVIPTNFEQDDDPFAQDPSEANDQAVDAAPDESDDEPGNDDPVNDATDAAAAEAPASPTPSVPSAAAPAPAEDVPPAADPPAPAEAPPDDVASSEAVSPPTPA